MQGFERIARARPKWTTEQIFQEIIAKLSDVGSGVQGFLQQVYGPSSSSGALWLLSAGARRPDQRPSVKEDIVEQSTPTLTSEEEQELLEQLRNLGSVRAEASHGDSESISPEAYEEQIRAVSFAQDEAVFEIEEAGRRTFSQYAEAVQEFKWSEFFVNCAGEAYFEWLRGQLLQSSSPGSPPLADRYTDRYPHRCDRNGRGVYALFGRCGGGFLCIKPAEP